MRFASYNDFELLYLVKEGSELALNILYEKYYYLTKKVAMKYFPYGDKLNDLIQEGLLILNYCLKKFDDRKPILFYSYFILCLNHRLSYLVHSSSYYKSYDVLNEKIGTEERVMNLPYYIKDLSVFDDLDKKIYTECIIEGFSLKAFALKYNIGYGKVYNRSKNIINELKKILTI